MIGGIDKKEFVSGLMSMLSSSLRRDTYAFGGLSPWGSVSFDKHGFFICSIVLFSALFITECLFKRLPLLMGADWLLGHARFSF